MSELSDPPRLAADPNAGVLGDWFREGQEDLPSAQQLARVAERLEPAFANPTPNTKPNPLSGKPLTRWLLGALGLAGVGLLALTLRGGEGEAPPVDPKPPAPKIASIPSLNAPAAPSSISQPLAPATTASEAPPTVAATAPSPSSAARNGRPRDRG